MKRNTKSALLLSVVSIVVCCAMLMGTTMAWFTDSVTSAKNVIVAGNLDVELYHTNPTETDELVDGTTDLFFTDINGKKILWEPGVVAYEKFTVKNEGNLALKYKLLMRVYDATANADGKTLEDVIKVAIANAVPTTRTDVASLDFKTLSKFTVENEDYLIPDDADDFIVVLYWEPSDNDNDYNMNNGENTVLDITFGVNLLATQLASEFDSFDNEYDKDATYTILVNSTNELVSSFENMTEATVFDATGISIDVDTVGTTTDEIIVPTFSIPTGATVKGVEFKFGASMISAEATAVSDTVVFDECDIVTADADTTDDAPAMALVGEMGTSVSTTKYVFNNCTFEGYIMLNGINAEFNNCTFVLSNANDGATYCSFGEYAFNNCTFSYEGGTNLIATNSIYADSYASVVLKDCTLVGATYGNSTDSTITVE